MTGSVLRERPCLWDLSRSYPKVARSTDQVDGSLLVSQADVSAARGASKPGCVAATKAESQQSKEKEGKRKRWRFSWFEFGH